MSRRDDAVAAFSRWLAGGEAVTPFTEDGWAVSAYREAFVFAPADRRRGNRLYLVLGSGVRAFSPATESLEEAYESLAGQRP